MKDYLNTFENVSIIDFMSIVKYSSDIVKKSQDIYYEEEKNRKKTNLKKWISIAKENIEQEPLKNIYEVAETTCYPEGFKKCVSLLDIYNIKIFKWNEYPENFTGDFFNNKNDKTIFKFLCKFKDWFFETHFNKEFSEEIIIVCPFHFKDNLIIESETVIYNSFNSGTMIEKDLLFKMFYTDYDTFYEENIQYLYELPRRLEKDGYRVEHNFKFDICPSSKNYIKLLNPKSQIIYIEFDLENDIRFRLFTNENEESQVKFNHSKEFSNNVYRYSSKDSYDDILKIIKNYEKIKYTKQFGYFENRRFFNGSEVEKFFNKFSSIFEKKYNVEFNEEHGTPYLLSKEPDLIKMRMIDETISFNFFDYMSDSFKEFVSFEIKIKYYKGQDCKVDFKISKNPTGEKYKSSMSGSFSMMMIGVEKFIENVYRGNGLPIKISY